MSQNTAIRTTPRTWDFLEPAMVPGYARTAHGVLAPAGAGLYLRYSKGQIIMQKNDGSNAWAKVGTSGYGGPPRLMKYSVLIDENGKWQLSDNVAWNPYTEIFQDSVEAYYQGYFKCEDLIGAGGTNEVQTETLTATGGTRTISWRGYTTAAIPFNASAATIKAAMLLAIPILATGDLTVTQSGTYVTVFTFTGNFAGSNVPPITIGTGLLTGGTSSVAETTPGAGLLTGVGRLVSGTSSVGVMQLGAATPV
jgi:hypothetical protein